MTAEETLAKKKKQSIEHWNAGITDNEKLKQN